MLICCFIYYTPKMLSIVPLRLNKKILLALLVVFAQSFTFDQVDDKRFPTPTSDQLVLNPRLNDKDNIQKGSSIDDKFIAFVKKNLQQSYAFNKDGTYLTQKYMFQKLNQTYPGNWTIIIIQSVLNSISPPAQDFDLISYSLNGTWWFYVRGDFNKYLPDHSYIFIRTSTVYPSDAISKYIYCYGPENQTSTIVSSIIEKAELSTSTIPEQLSQISQNIEKHSPGMKYNYFLGIPEFEGDSYHSRFNIYVYGKYQISNYIVPTLKNKYWFTTF